MLYNRCEELYRRMLINEIAQSKFSWSSILKGIQLIASAA